MHARLLHQLALELYGLADPGLGFLEALGDGLLGDLGSSVFVVLPGVLGAARLDHHDRDIIVDGAAGDDELERGLVTLLIGRMWRPLALGRPRDADGADRAFERDARDHQGRGGGVDGHDVVGVLLVGAEDGADDLGLVAIAVDERRPEGPVDQPTGQDGVIGGATLTPEERAGDLPRCVRPLLDVHGEGEEVNPLADAVGCVGRDEDHGVADAADHSTLGLGGEPSGLERQRLVGARDGARHGNGFRHVHSSAGRRRASCQLSDTPAPRPGYSATGSWRCRA